MGADGEAGGSGTDADIYLNLQQKVLLQKLRPAAIRSPHQVAKVIMRLHLNKNFLTLQDKNQGFTLIEILVALVLIVLYEPGPQQSFSSRNDLDKEVYGIERAIRLCQTKPL